MGRLFFLVCVSVCAAMTKLIVAMYVAHSVQIIKNLSRRRFGRVAVFPLMLYLLLCAPM